MRLPDPCSATTRAGLPCRMAARRDSGLCVNHDPAYAEQRKKNHQRAVQAASEVRRFKPIPLEDFELASRPGVQALIDATARQVLSGELDGARARYLIRLLSMATRNLGRHGLYDAEREYYFEHRPRIVYSLASMLRHRPSPRQNGED